MLSRNLRKGIIGATVFSTVLLIMSSSVLATEPHEDPEKAEVVFSGISLLRYYSDSLNYVLQKDPDEVEARLEKMPFANILQRLEESADDFTSASINISHQVVEIDKGLSDFQTLMGQFRLNEAAEQATRIFIRLHQAYDELENIEEAVNTTGEELQVFSAPDESDLRRSYDELQERIDRIREMLALYQQLLESTGISLDELLESAGITMEEFLESPDIITEYLLESIGIVSLSSTSLTLKVQPISAFVGDTISFEGVLTSEGKPLAGREIDILLNSSRYITASTDSRGHYQGDLQVPYWYIPQLDLQAIYYPRDKDTGLYLASLSPLIKLKVLFYEADLEITVEERAYPGLETTVNGEFDYGESPPLVERKAEIYLDHILITDDIIQKEFTREIKIDPEMDVGKHIITVSAVPAGRYSPVVTSAILDITRAIPVLDLGLPGIALIPGSFGVDGKLYSEIGPLNEAAVTMQLGKSQLELLSSGDGSFDTKIGMGMGFGLIGSQDIAIQVLPREPYHAPLVTTRSLVIVNMVNCGSILVILVFLGVYLPRRIKRRFGLHLRRREGPAEVITQPETAPVYSQGVLVPIPTEESGKIHMEPKESIFYWYRFVINIIQRIGKVLLKPQQTLREFASESSRIIGPTARYFIELTRMVERLLYSPYRPTEDDAQRSEHISSTIRYHVELLQIMPRLLYSKLRPAGKDAEKS